MFKIEFVGIVVAAFCLVGYNAVELEGTPEGFAKDCATEFNLKPEQKAFFNNADLNANYDETTKCYMKCLYSSVGIVDSEGKLLPGGGRFAAEHFFAETEDNLKKTDELFKICATATDVEKSEGNVSCERAYQLFKCFFQNVDKVGLTDPKKKE